MLDDASTRAGTAPTRSHGPEGTQMESYISVRGVEMIYETARGDSFQALAPTDLDISKGEFVSLIGPSGCGKSTLLNIVGGMRRPNSGTVKIDGTVVSGPDPQQRAFVFQDYTLFPWRTVLANVEVGLEFRGVAKAERKEVALSQLQLVGLQKFSEAYPNELSGGMQQRVALARALAMDPEILLMDEPFGALDEQTRMVLGEEVARILESTSKTILFVTHSLAEAIYLADRVVVMSAGPGRIKQILEVDEPRPRQPAFMTSDVFHKRRDELFELLHDEFRAAALLEMEGQEDP